MQSITAQFEAWVRTKPADEAYEYIDPRGCAFCQFLKAAGYPVDAVIPGFWRDAEGRRHCFPEGLERALVGYERDLPNGGRTFGALADRLAKQSA